MSRSGDEMILELASLLNTSTVKTAAKKDDKKEDKDDKSCKCGKKDCDCGKKEDKDDNKKKASVIAAVVNDLVKIANDLDEAGAQEASDLVDDALRVILDNIKKDEQ